MITKGRASILVAVVFLLFLITNRSSVESYRQTYIQQQPDSRPPPDDSDMKFRWADVPQIYPVTSMIAVPTSIPSSIPRIQHNFPKETAMEKKIRIARLNAVKGNFTHAWKGYETHAWLQDEVMPLSGGAHDPFGGWAATLVDSLGGWL